jgi:Sec-independent protein translocase protein TatA
MQKVIRAGGLLAVLVVAVLAMGLPRIANAQQSQTGETQSTVEAARQEALERAEQAKERAQQKAEEAKQKADQARGQAQDAKQNAIARLEGAKLKACQTREKAVTNIMARIADRGQKQIDVFTKIADRTKAFYQDKNRPLSNYDALVAEVNATQEAAVAANAVVKNVSINFACEGDNPKAVAGSFKDLVKTQNTALKEYRTAVKNLIVGVKSAQSTQATTPGADNQGAQ